MKKILQLIHQFRNQQNKYLYIFAFLGVLLILSAIFRAITPTLINTENSWQELTPGHSTASEVQEKLGEPKNIVQHTSYSVMEYDSPFPTMPHEVAIDNSNKVIFIKELLAYDEDHKLDQYLEKNKTVDLELYAPMVSDAVKAHVFLKEGFLVIAHLKDGSVEQKWYFVPTDEEIFLKSWEKELKQKQRGPEKFIPQ